MNVVLFQIRVKPAIFLLKNKILEDILMDESNRNMKPESIYLDGNFDDYLDDAQQSSTKPLDENSVT